jgi:hypothetical protein
MKIYLISARNGEFVGFTDRRDAKWTATGKNPPFGVPSLGEDFRENYADDDASATFPMIEIELTPEQVKQLEVP